MHSKPTYNPIAGHMFDRGLTPESYASHLGESLVPHFIAVLHDHAQVRPQVVHQEGSKLAHVCIICRQIAAM
jgi:hypothetical protein